MADIVRQIHKAAAVDCGEARCDAFLESLSAAQHREEERKGSPDRIECVIPLLRPPLRFHPPFMRVCIGKLTRL